TLSTSQPPGPAAVGSRQANSRRYGFPRPTRRSSRNWPRRRDNRFTSTFSDPVGIGRERWGTVDHVINQTVFAGFFWPHEAVAVGIFLEFLQRLAGVPLVDLVELFLHADKLFRMDHDIGRGTFHARQRLVYHDPPVR